MAAPPAKAMTWDEAETVLRQLEKELRAAAMGHAAFRLAREADATYQQLKSDIARLTKDRDELQATLAQERAQAETERGKRDATRAADATAHTDAVEQRRQELAGLDQALATARKAMQTADVERTRVLAGIDRDAKAHQRAADQAHAAALEAQRVELAALETERQRVETLLQELKVKIAALA